MQLALRLAFASTNIQCRSRQSHVKIRTDSDECLCFACCFYHWIFQVWGFSLFWGLFFLAAYF